MIFVTVGTELPFERMVRVVDDWARCQGRTDVFAQIGRTDWRPSFIPYAEYLEPSEFNHWFSRATTIIAHAGMGTILSALLYEKPILVMPRRAALGEQRNDHQMATAHRLLELGKIHVALDEHELLSRLNHLAELQTRARAAAFASPRLTAALREFIHRGHQNDTAPRAAGESASSAVGGPA